MGRWVNGSGDGVMGGWMGVDGLNVPTDHGKTLQDH